MSALISREAAKARDVFAGSCSAAKEAIDYLEQLMLNALPPAQEDAPLAFVSERVVEILKGGGSGCFDMASPAVAADRPALTVPVYIQRTATAVKVKPLEWEHGHKFCGQDCSYADTEFGAWMMVAYSGRGGRWAHIDPAGNDSEDDWETRDECQVAANADYQSRILAALEGGGA